jgi:pimeloyl-ACP methyl ester carboxylesterase
LPAAGGAPATARLEAEIGTVDGSHPPALRTIDLEVAKTIEVDAVGLPTCRAAQITATSSADARRACGGALLGSGSAEVEVAFPEQAPFSSTGPLLLFNAGVRGATTKVLLHAYVDVPAPTAIVVAATIARIDRGPYGLEITATIPRIAGGAGSVTKFELKVGRKFSYEGRSRSFLTASCPTGRWAPGGKPSSTTGRNSDWAPIAAWGRRLVRFDWRGHGKSTGFPESGDYAWTNLAEDLLVLIEELSPGTPVSAMGSSMGTAAILFAAIKAPHQFDRLVLSAPPAGWEARAAQAGLYEQFADVVERDGAVAFEKAVAGMPVQGRFRELPDYPPQLKVTGALLASVLRGGARSNLPDPDLIAGLEVPALVLSWADDPAHPVATGERLSQLLPQAEFQVASTVTELHTWGTLAADFLADD